MSLTECLEEGKIDEPTKDLLDVNTGAEWETITSQRNERAQKTNKNTNKQKVPYPTPGCFELTLLVPVSNCWCSIKNLSDLYCIWRVL